MSESIHRKLVRDNTPGIIASNGDTAVTRTLNNEEFVQALLAKIEEETAQLRVATSPSERIGTLADALEAIYSLANALGHRNSTVHKAVMGKFQSDGGYAKRIWLESIIEGTVDEQVVAA